VEAGEGSPSEPDNRTPQRAAVIQTPAGRQLEELRCGVHQHEEVRYWQANLLFKRVSEQASHPV
jgi:hypothetical protein